MTNDKVDVDIVFLKPEKFEDCVKCAEYIRDNKIVNMNLSQLDEKDSRRVLDYVTGAIFITEAEIINIGNKVFCSVPSMTKYEIISSSKSHGSFREEEEEEEEIVPFRR